MRLTRGMIVIGALVMVGTVRVWQQTALLKQGYAVAERLERLRNTERDVRWTQAEVDRLSGPGRLAQVAEHRRFEMVAWSPLPIAPRVVVMERIASRPVADDVAVGQTP